MTQDGLGSCIGEIVQVIKLQGSTVSICGYRLWLSYALEDQECFIARMYTTGFLTLDKYYCDTQFISTVHPV